MKLKDQVAIVTGAGRNIGEEIARLFAAEGAKVAVVDMDKPRGERVRATIEIIWLSGWAPHESQQKPLVPGSAKASLAEAVKRSSSST